MTLTFPNVVGSIEVYMDVMRAICGETEGKSMIDLCCGFAPNTPKLGFSKRWYFDIIDRKLDHEEEQKYFIQSDVLNIVPDHPNGPFDVAICSDGIEHLKMNDGMKLINTMTQISDRQIIFTPLHDIFGMAKEGDNDPEAHRSLWSPKIMPFLNHIVFPDYHKTWNGGAFWSWNVYSVDMIADFERVKSILKTKQWSYGLYE